MRDAPDSKLSPPKSLDVTAAAPPLIVSLWMSGF